MRGGSLEVFSADLSIFYLMWTCGWSVIMLCEIRLSISEKLFSSSTFFFHIHTPSSLYSLVKFISSEFSGRRPKNTGNKLVYISRLMHIGPNNSSKVDPKVLTN